MPANICSIAALASFFCSSMAFSWHFTGLEAGSNTEAAQACCTAVGRLAARIMHGWAWTTAKNAGHQPAFQSSCVDPESGGLCLPHVVWLSFRACPHLCICIFQTSLLATRCLSKTGSVLQAKPPDSDTRTHKVQQSNDSVRSW